MEHQANSAVRPGGLVGQVELLLRNRYRFFVEIRDGIDVRPKIQAMIVYAALFLAVFGAVIGSENSVWQAVASAVKLPLLFLLTLLVCFPTLYFFNTIFEASLGVSQNLALLLTAIVMTSIVLLAFAPVVVFFMLATSSYQFFKLLKPRPRQLFKRAPVEFGNQLLDGPVQLVKREEGPVAQCRLRIE